MNAQMETLIFVVVALLVGVVIFGGTTLAYFLGLRRSDPPADPRKG